MLQTSRRSDQYSSGLERMMEYRLIIAYAREQLQLRESRKNDSIESNVAHRFFKEFERVFVAGQGMFEQMVVALKTAVEGGLSPKELFVFRKEFVRTRMFTTYP